MQAKITVDPFLVEIIANRIKRADGKFVHAIRKIRVEKWPAMLKATLAERKELYRQACQLAKKQGVIVV